MADANLETLRVKAAKAAMKLHNAEEEERNRVSRPVLRKLVGKCFKYLNSYGGDRPKWWLYSRVVGFDEAKMTFKTVQFQHTSADHIEVMSAMEWNFSGQSRLGVEDGWHPISLREYLREQRRIIKTIAKITSA